MEGLGGFGSFLPLILMFVVLYFLLIRPQQKRQRETREMHSNLQKGNKIVTIGGLHAIIEAIDEVKVILRVGDGAKLTYDRQAIREVVQE